jgi:hypothetical protein
MDLIRGISSKKLRKRGFRQRYVVFAAPLASEEGGKQVLTTALASEEGNKQVLTTVLAFEEVGLHLLGALEVVFQGEDGVYKSWRRRPLAEKGPKMIDHRRSLVSGCLCSYHSCGFGWAVSAASR